MNNLFENICFCVDRQQFVGRQLISAFNMGQVMSFIRWVIRYF